MSSTESRLRAGAVRRPLVVAAATGAVLASSTIAVVAATGPNAPVVTARPAPLTSETTATFAFTVRARRTAQCRLDAARAFTPCASPVTYTGLAPGAHLFRVRSATARESSAVTTVRWTVTAPVARSFTVTGSVTGLVPGVARPVEVTLTNPGSVPLRVTSLTVTVSADSTPPGCRTAANLDVLPATVSAARPVTVPARGTARVPAGDAPRLRLRDLPTVDQQACKGRSFALTFTGTATGSAPPAPSRPGA